LSSKWDNIVSLADAIIKLKQLDDRVLENLENSTLEIKRLALDALDIRVFSSTDTIEIKCVIPLELALSTTEQTSGSLSSHEYSWAIPFQYAIRI